MTIQAALWRLAVIKGDSRNQLIARGGGEANIEELSRGQV